jgi:TPR repeat protein
MMNLRNRLLESLILSALVMLLPALSMAGMSPEEVQAFQLNKAKAEAGEGLPSHYIDDPGAASPFGGVGSTSVDVNGKPISYNDPSPSPAALLANAYLTGAGVEKDESEAFFWYKVVRGHSLPIPNEKAFLAMIRSMPAIKIDGVLRRLSARQDALYKAETSRIKALSDSKFKSLSQFDAYSFDHCVEGVRWVRHALRDAARCNQDEMNELYPIVNWLYEVNVADNTNYSFLLFPLGENFYKIRDELIAKGRRRIDQVIDGSTQISSSDMWVVSDAYAYGYFGLKVDAAQRRKWHTKACEVRFDEALEMRKKSDAGGPDEWLGIAQESRYSSDERIKRVLGSSDAWYRRYEESVGLKAELGDLASIDEMIEMFMSKVGNSGGFKVSPDRNDLLKWIAVRHKISRLPSDAIILAHAYGEEGDKCFSPEIRAGERSRLTRGLAHEYLKSLFDDAASGDLIAKLKLAVLSDSNLFVTENYSKYDTAHKYKEILGHLSGQHYSFEEDARLLQKLRETGDQILGAAAHRLGAAAHRKSGQPSPFSTNFKPVSTRDLYLDFINASDKQESLMKPIHPAGLVSVLKYLAVHDEEIESSFSAISDKKSPDSAVSLKWYRRLAELGDTDAICKIAHSYHKGRGFTADAVTAYAYYALAGAGPAYQNFSEAEQEAVTLYLTTVGTNEKRLDACFKLSTTDKELAFKKYKELLDGFSSRVTRNAESIAKADFEREDKYMREYQAAQAAKKSAEKK